MTDKPTPTDAATPECLTCRDHGAVGNILTAEPCPDCTRWNVQPAPATQQAGEVVEVAEHYRNAIASACEGWTMPDGLRKHLETALWSPPTPQPTKAQAAEPVAWAATSEDGVVEALGMNQSRRFDTPLYLAPQPVEREPLTDEQIQDLLLCGDPTDEEMRLIRIGWDAANGIKGGQHVS